MEIAEEYTILSEMENLSKKYIEITDERDKLEEKRHFGGKLVL